MRLDVGTQLLDVFQVGGITHLILNLVGGGEQCVVHYVLGVREDLAVLAKEGVEGLQLNVRLLHQLDPLVALIAGHEVVDINVGRCRSDTVHAADALHEAGGVPRRVVVEDHVGAM